MKRALLLFAIVLLGHSLLFSQGSISDRLTLKKTTERVEIKVFPNPVVNHFSIDNHDDIQNILVFNLVGRELKRFEYADGEKYYLSELPNGVYLLQFISNDNKILTTQRISKR